MREPALVALLACALLSLYRVLRGPTLLDRLAAADAVGVMLTMVLVLLGNLLRREVFLDVAMVYALLMFADVLIMARYIGQGGGTP